MASLWEYALQLNPLFGCTPFPLLLQIFVQFSGFLENLILFYDLSHFDLTCIHVKAWLAINLLKQILAFVDEDFASLFFLFLYYPSGLFILFFGHFLMFKPSDQMAHDSLLFRILFLFNLFLQNLFLLFSDFV